MNLVFLLTQVVDGIDFKQKILTEKLNQFSTVAQIIEGIQDNIQDLTIELTEDDFIEMHFSDNFDNGYNWYVLTFKFSATWNTNLYFTNAGFTEKNAFWLRDVISKL